MSQKNVDNRSNQLNPNNPSFHQSRGMSDRPSDWGSKSYSSDYNYTKTDLDNHSNQLNPNNSLYQPSQNKGK